MKRVQFAVPDFATLQQELKNNFRHKRAFVAGVTSLSDREICQLIIVHPNGTTFELQAEAVWINPDGPSAGVGFALHDLNARALERLEDFVNYEPQQSDALHNDAPGDLSSRDLVPASTPDERDIDARQMSEAIASEDPIARNVHERIRGLSIREREVVARQGTLPERVALERRFGGSVWESLLQNPQLTPPEVAKIAKNGTVPVPLVAIIVANAGWLAKPEIQRALLTNPRVSGAHLDRVLHAMPRGDLLRAAENSAYRAQVRSAAKKLVGI